MIIVQSISRSFSSLCLFFCVCVRLTGSSPNQELSPGHQSEPGILTSRPPGKSSFYKTENLYPLNAPFPSPAVPGAHYCIFHSYCWTILSLIQVKLFSICFLWLISLRIMSSRFTEVVSGFPSFLRLNDSRCMFIPHFLIHSSLMPIWIISSFSYYE